MSIRKHLLKHINESNLLSFNNEISFEQSDNTLNKAANDTYIKKLYDFKNCKEGDLLYYHNELGFNLLEGRKEFGDQIHIYGRCVLPYDGKSVTFTFLPYLDFPSEKTWFAHIRKGNFWAKRIYNCIENPNYKFTIRMASYDIFEKIYMDQTGLLNRGGFPDDSEFAGLPLIRKYREDSYWCDQENQKNTKEALLLIPYEKIYSGHPVYRKEINYKYVPKSEKFNAIYTITFTFPKIRKSLLKESTDFNSLLQIDNDIEFDKMSSNSINQKVTNNVKEWQFVQDNFVDLGLPSGTLWCKYNLGATCQDIWVTWYGKYFYWTDIEGSYKFISADKLKDIVPTYDTHHDSLLQHNEDAVSTQMGNNCTTPTAYQFQELLDNCERKYVENYNGIDKLKGILLTGPNGNTIFFPLAGYLSGLTGVCGGGTFSASEGKRLYMWSSNIVHATNGVNTFASALTMSAETYSEEDNGIWSYVVTKQCSVRGVHDKM